MDFKTLLLIYFLIGLAYVIVNVVVRKLDTEGDPMLPLAWWFLWIIFLPLLLIEKSCNAVKRYFNAK